MSHTHSHRLTKYVHVQTQLGPKQTAKRAICKACESKENLFEKGRNEGFELWEVYEKWGFFNRWDRVQRHWKKCSYWREFWIEEDHEVMMYEDPDENIARNAVNALRLARRNNGDAMSISTTSVNYSMTTSSSGLTSVSRNVKRPRTKANTTLDTYVIRPISAKDQLDFHHRILRMVVENGLAFRFVESKTFHEVIAFFHTDVKIPNRRTLSKKILAEYATKVERARISALLESQEPITIMFDGWTNVRCQEILGAVILSATNKVYIWGAEDISGKGHKTPDVLETIYSFLERAKNQSLNVVAMVSDSASAYASARRQIQVQRKDIVFLPCFAHQANLCVGNIFKYHGYDLTAKQAIEVVSYFTDKRHTKAILALREEQQRIYNTSYSFVRPVTTRWNSYYYCFASLIRSKRALQAYSIMHSGSNELSDKARDAIDDTAFWVYLTELVDHLLPFVSILNYLQRDAANLFDVIYAFGYVAQRYENEIDGFSCMMLQQLEKRWAKWEQPLLFLSVVFHPRFRAHSLSDKNFFTIGRITHWVEYYYEAWFNEKPKNIPLELTEYYTKRGIFSDERFENTIKAISAQDMESNNVIGLALIRYWEFAAIDQKEIGKVALRLYSIKVNSASCERLFSRMGWYQSPKRYNLKLQTIFWMTQIAAEMAWEERLEDINKIRKIVTTNNEVPALSRTINFSDIIQVSMLDNGEVNDEEIDYERNEDSDDIDNDDDEELTDEESIFEEWSRSGSDNEEPEDEEPENEEFEISTTFTAADMLYCHPVVHKNSKTELQYLFTCNLSQPIFIRTLREDLGDN